MTADRPATEPRTELARMKSCTVCGVGYLPGRYSEHCSGGQHRSVVMQNRKSDR